MYKIIGVDRKEYGPVTADQIKQWIATRRCNQDSLVRLEGTKAWRPLLLFPEFNAALSEVPKPRAASLPDTSPLPVSSPKGPGALRVLMIVVAVLVGGVVLLGILTTILVPNFVKARQRAQTIQCRNNLQTLATAIRTYATEHGGNLPIPSGWAFQLKGQKGFPASALICPANPQNSPSYAYNEKLKGRGLFGINPKTVLLLESNSSANGAARGMSDMCCRYHSLINSSGSRTSEKVFLVALMDGTVISIPESELSTLRWDP